VRFLEPSNEALFLLVRVSRTEAEQLAGASSKPH